MGVGGRDGGGDFFSGYLTFVSRTPPVGTT